MIIDGEWSTDGGHGAQTLRIGTAYRGNIRQRGGDSIYAKCWTITFNGQQVAEIHDDVLYAKAWVERLFVSEVERILPTYQRLAASVPPWECFEGTDADIKWRNWKHENFPRWSLTASKDHINATQLPGIKEGEA